MPVLSPFEERSVAIINNNLRCERNLQYGSRIESYFRLNGWSVREDFLADLVIVSGCGFHESQYEKVKTALSQLDRLGFSQGRIVIMGCLPKTHEEQLKSTFVGRTVALEHEAALDEFIGATIPFDEVPEPNVFHTHPSAGGSKDVEEFFFIRIARGCTSQCAFCVIREAKGYTRSVPMEEIERQYREALANNKRRICLISEDALAYGADTGLRISDLLDQLLAIDDNVELHLTSIHALWFPRFAEMLSSLCRRGIIRELRIGVQHVNQSLLGKMGRAGKFSDYYAIIRRLRDECPDLYLEADIIVGFPGETDEMFDELVHFFEQDRCFNRVQHFAYSDVSGAPAVAFPDKVPTATKIARWQKLDLVLGDRSSYRNTSQYSKMGDVLFKLSQENDYLFLKDSCTTVDTVDTAKPQLIPVSSLIRVDARQDFSFDDRRDVEERTE